VSENRELRDPQPVRVVRDGVVSVALPPLRVDCSYLVTTWSSLDGAAKVAAEHRLLGEALTWLAGFGTVPVRFLRGRLVGQPYPPPTLVAQLAGKQEVGEFWHSLGIAPRPAFELTVTVALALDAVTPVGPRVETVVLNLTTTPVADGPGG
jgi:hypothetical protein